MGLFLDGLDAEAYHRKYSDGELLRRIATYFRPHCKTIVLVALVPDFGALFPPVSATPISAGSD